MAGAPGHRFGQIIGNLLEELLAERLALFCSGRDLVLDKKGPRKGVRTGSKLTWKDRYGNFHDLDFVIEKARRHDEPVRPIAFVESAWRRYTKHSRNKVQEISGAVVPISEVYDRDAPFMGAVLAGHFSGPSIEQLRRLNFNVVYLDYEHIMTALEAIGIEARFDEETPDEDFGTCVAILEDLSDDERAALKRGIIDACEADFADFFAELQGKLDRHIERIMVLPLFGTTVDFATVAEAAAFVDGCVTTTATGPFQRFEVVVDFSNGDVVRAGLQDPAKVRDFLDYVAR